MECGEAAREKDEGCTMVAFELEAAEALAGLARTRGGGSSSGELKRTEAALVASATHSKEPGVSEPVCDNASTMITCPQMAEKVVESSPSQSCRTCSQSNPEIKLRRKLTEAEKQERKIRRILANRESARETIRRRQAMYLELTRKVAEVVEENENLKKKKKLAVEEYNLLKGRNKFLKTQLAEIKEAAAREAEEERMASEAENPCSSTATPPPIFLPAQPSIFPCFWPSIFPSSDVFPFQCPSHSSSSQFNFPPRDIPCSHLRQENSNGLGTPLFVVPVPWLLPYLTHSNNKPNTPQCSKCSCSDSQPHEDKNESLSNQNTKADAPTKTMVVPGLFRPVRPVEIPGPPQVDDTSDVNDVSTPESRFSQRNQTLFTQKKPEDVFAASVARRRRKELLKLKNVNCHDVRTRF